MARTLLLMLDGISADAVVRHEGDLPTLQRLADSGTYVERLASDIPATSLPGRTGILTGVAPAQHGIYGNLIQDGARFRYAHPGDVRVPTLPQRAMQAGLDVAVLGYGMVRPEDAHTFHPPWWVAEMMQRGRDAEPTATEDGWLRTLGTKDERGHIARNVKGADLATLPDPYAGDRTVYLMAGLEGDRRLVRHLSALAQAEDGPDFLLGEVLIPDSVQHVAGQDHPFSVWSMTYADSLVGMLLADLQDGAERLPINVVLVSDHGHGEVTKAFYPERILPGETVSPEGGTLYVTVADEKHRARVTERLAPHGIEPLETSPLPSDVEASVAAYVAPFGMAFERVTSETESAALHGFPAFLSTHGLRPGSASDDRFLIAAGPDVPRQRISHADASSVEATLATLLGLPIAGEGVSLVPDSSVRS